MPGSESHLISVAAHKLVHISSATQPILIVVYLCDYFFRAGVRLADSAAIEEIQE
jgi:hypothetical protein